MDELERRLKEVQEDIIGNTVEWRKRKAPVTTGAIPRNKLKDFILFLTSLLEKQKRLC